MRTGSCVASYAGQLGALLGHYLQGEPEATVLDDFGGTLAAVQEVNRAFEEYQIQLHEWENRLG